eukprot:6194118-Pleurochrysis_carterae.AAC.1
MVPFRALAGGAAPPQRARGPRLAAAVQAAALPRRAEAPCPQGGAAPARDASGAPVVVPRGAPAVAAGSTAANRLRSAAAGRVRGRGCGGGGGARVAAAAEHCALEERARVARNRGAAQVFFALRRALRRCDAGHACRVRAKPSFIHLHAAKFLVF